MRISRKAALLGAAITLASAAPAIAQGTATDPMTMTDTRDDDDGDDGKWGLLGLLGLVGLLGLKRRDRDDPRNTTSGPSTSGRL